MNIITEIFNDLEKNGIRICHFKSNRNLGLSFRAEADFDVIIESKNRSKCAQILLNHGCKRFEPQAIGWYPGVENWLAFDNNTGLLYHIHLHNQLASGKQLLKDYILPWGELIVKNSVYNEQFGIYTAEPHMEMVLLLTRIAIKSKASDNLKATFGCWKNSKDMQQEFEWLKAQMEEETFLKTAAIMYSTEVAPKLWKIVQKKRISSGDLKNIQKLAKDKLFYQHWYGNGNGRIKSWLLRFTDLKNKFLMRKFGKMVNTKKVTPSGGLVIAFIGGDGSGKSTVTKTISKWLGRKADCERVYMGEGAGKKNLFATITKGVYAQVKRKSNKNNSQSKNAHVSLGNKVSLKKTFVMYIHALTIYSIVKDNRKKIIRMHRKKLLGGYTVLDRYPQTKIKNRNDGPKLERYAEILRSKCIAKLAVKERKILSIADELQPDVVFRLNICAETAMERKPEEISDIEEFRKKLDEIKNITYDKAIMIDIDAEKNFEDEILDIKRAIWGLIG